MEKQVLKREFNRRPPLEGVLILFFLFALTLGLGIFTALRLVQLPEFQEEQITSISLWQFLLNVLLAFFLIGIVFFLGRKFKEKKRSLLKALFMITIGLGSFISLGMLFGDFAIFLVLILLFLWLKKPYVLLQDLLIVLGIAGTGGYLGIQLDPETVVFLLVIFSIYDYIAVYKTKHMVKMAKEMMKEGAILGLILPQKLGDFKVLLNEVMPGGERFFILGGGDIVFPLIFSASLVSEGILSALIVAIFALIGLFANFYFMFSQKTRKPIPALPLIALFSIIGFLITRLI